MTHHLIDTGHNMDRRTTLARFLKMERRAAASDRIAIERLRGNREWMKSTLATFIAPDTGQRIQLRTGARIGSLGSSSAGP